MNPVYQRIDEWLNERDVYFGEASRNGRDNFARRDIQIVSLKDMHFDEPPVQHAASDNYIPIDSYKSFGSEQTPSGLVKRKPSLYLRRKMTTNSQTALE
jgi:hypothetical protein